MYFDMNLFMVDNELFGNGVLFIELLDIEGRDVVYIYFDQINNEFMYVNIIGDFVLINILLLIVNMFYCDI